MRAAISLEHLRSRPVSFARSNPKIAIFVKLDPFLVVVILGNLVPPIEPSLAHVI